MTQPFHKNLLAKFIGISVRWPENSAGCALALCEEALNFLELFGGRRCGSFLFQDKNEQTIVSIFALSGFYEKRLSRNITCTFLLPFFFLTIDSGWAQSTTNVWKNLSDVEVKDRYDASVGYEVSYPVFGDRAQVLDGQQVTVKGYMIPFEAYLKPNYFILSALPIAACFFCGGAGPETVMEVFSQENIELSQEVIELRGRLELNPDNPDRMMYILHDAELVEN